MTLVGKIFTVLIFVMSLVFMTCTVLVYATHRNWMEIITNDGSIHGMDLGLAKQLENKESRNQELRDQQARLQVDLATQRKAVDQALSKHEIEYDLLEGIHEDLLVRQAELLKDQRDAIASLATAHLTLQSLRQQNETLTADIFSAEQVRDTAMKDAVRASEESHAAVAEFERIKKRQVELSQDLAKANDVLRKFGLDGTRTYPDVAPIVDGLVKAATQQDLIEISIGEDDGLLKGHKLQVVRIQGARKIYVGRIEVVHTDYDKSVCKVDPNYRISPVQVNDRVFSRIAQF